MMGGTQDRSEELPNHLIALPSPIDGSVIWGTFLFVRFKLWSWCGPAIRTDTMGTHGI